MNTAETLKKYPSPDSSKDFDTRYIVKYRDGHTPLSRQQFKETTLKLSKSNVEVLIIKSDEELEKIKANASVEYVEKDHKVFMMGSRKVQVQQETVPYGIDMVNARLVDSQKAFSRSVCVIDSGFDYGHPDLQRSNVDGYDSTTTLPWNRDSYGHGTHVSGIIAALGNNNEGVVGIIPDGNLRIYVVRVFDESESWAWTSDLVEAMYFCVEAGSDIINMSLGSPNYSEHWEVASKDIYENKNVLLVASSGNNGNTDYYYPASFDAVMSVGAVDSNTEKAWFSQHNNQVDIVAPGEDILSTEPRTDQLYGISSGTSMAAAHTSGVAALVWSHFTSLTATEIRNVLEHTAVDLGNFGRDDKYGHGLIDAKAAFEFLSQGSTLSPTESPTMFSCQDGKKSFELKLVTDKFFSETNWILQNSNEETPLEGNHEGVISCVSDELYYKFTIFDSYGDGICCDYGTGWYKVFYDDVLIHHGKGEFGYNESIVFGSSPSPSLSPSNLLTNLPTALTDLPTVVSPPINRNGGTFLHKPLFYFLFSVGGLSIIVLGTIIFFKRKRKTRRILNIPIVNETSNKNEAVN